MAKRHLIALDLDGTLLLKNQEISPRTKTALMKAKEKGHVIAIATGRPYRASKRYYQELQLTTPIINFNGASVHHPLDAHYPRILESIPLAYSKELIKRCETIGVFNVMVEIGDTFYMKKQAGFFAEFLTDGVEPAGTGELHALVKEAPTAILIEPKPEKVNVLHDTLQQTGTETTLQRWWKGETRILEIAPRNVTKATALERIANDYGIEQGNIIAFGDEENDYEMIEYAGHGVAMGNAIDEIKAVADCVTETNEKDGIACYLEKVLHL